MKIACKHMDRLVSVQLRPTTNDSLYEIYKLLDGDGPVSWQLAQAILEHPGCTAGIVAGAGSQNSGHSGAVVLARALDQLGYRVTLYAEPSSARSLLELEKELGTAVQVEELADNSQEALHGIAQKLDICIFVEKPGLNERGTLCLTGADSAAVDWIAWEMDELGKVTMGIGDNAGMIGFGKRFTAAGRLGNPGGTVTRTATTYLYPVSNANWGAYALVAALAIAMKRPELALQPEEEQAMLGRSSQEDASLSVGVVRMIKEMVDITLSTNDRKF